MDIEVEEDDDEDDGGDGDSVHCNGCNQEKDDDGACKCKDILKTFHGLNAKLWVFYKVGWGLDEIQDFRGILWSNFLFKTLIFYKQIQTFV